jgi:hypothetical protein
VSAPLSDSNLEWRAPRQRAPSGGAGACYDQRVRCLGIGVLLLVAWPVGADEAWATFDTRDGATYQRRSVPGSRFHEYRASLTMTVPPADVARAVWSAITDSAPATVKKREVLSRGADDLVVYEQIHTPVVSDRDVTLRFHRGAQGQGFEIAFENANQLGPPPMAGFVRLPVVRGKWTLTPVAGGTRVVYECYSEPGGSIPAFLVRGTQQSQVAHDVDRALATLPRVR